MSFHEILIKLLVNIRNIELIHKEDWSKIYSLPFRSCKEVKTKIFQYKINMDSLMTNVRLFKMKIVDDDSCSFCSKLPETMMHILYDCEQVKKVWIQFENWWESHSHVRLNLCYKSIVFGYNINHPDLLLNLCIILLKKMIFNCRFKHRVPTLAQFEDLVSFNYNLERKIAFANNTMHKFLFKWKILKSVVQIE